MLIDLAISTCFEFPCCLWFIMDTHFDLVRWLYFTSHRQRGHLETTPHLLFLAKDVKLGFTPSPPGIEPRAVTW